MICVKDTSHQIDKEEMRRCGLRLQYLGSRLLVLMNYSQTATFFLQSRVTGPYLTLV